MNYKEYRCMKTSKGMTLVELLIAVVILGVVMVIAPLMFFRILESQRFSLEEGEASATASRAVKSVAKVIWKARQADNGAFPIAAASANSFTFYSNVDADAATERVHIYLEDETLKMGVRNPSTDNPPTYANGDETVTDLVEHVVNASGEPVFEYYGSPNEVLSAPVSTGYVRMVNIHLYINIDPSKAPDNINIEEIVSLRNLNEYNKVY